MAYNVNFKPMADLSAVRRFFFMASPPKLFRMNRPLDKPGLRQHYSYYPFSGHEFILAMALRKCWYSGNYIYIHIDMEGDGWIFV